MRLLSCAASGPVGASLCVLSVVRAVLRVRVCPSVLRSFEDWMFRHTEPIKAFDMLQIVQHCEGRLGQRRSCETNVFPIDNVRFGKTNLFS